MDFMPEVIGGGDSDEEVEIVKLEMKDLSDTTDIFDTGEKVKPVEAVISELPSSTDKPQKKKRVMSESHKEKLALARVKALPKVKKVKEEVVNEETEEEEPNFIYEAKPQKPKPVANSQYKYTQEQVDNITFKAISNYDALRKERKKEKEVLRKDEAHKEAERQKLLRVATGLNTNKGAGNYWDNCY